MLKSTSYILVNFAGSRIYVYLICPTFFSFITTTLEQASISSLMDDAIAYDLSPTVYFTNNQCIPLTLTMAPL